MPIMMNNVELKKVDKLKYLGYYFHAQFCKVDTSYGIRKFYGNFNNIFILSVIGYNKNEMATRHPLKTYCVPTVLHGCETWYLECQDYHRLNVICNNSFWRIFTL